MASFDVVTRKTFLDVSGAIVILLPDGIVEDGENPGTVFRWKNQSLINIGPRFGDATPDDPNNVGLPIIDFGGGNRSVAINQFTLANQQSLILPTLGGAFTSGTKWSFAITWDNPGAIATASQTTFAFGNDDFKSIARDAGNTQHGYVADATTNLIVPVRDSQEIFYRGDEVGAMFFTDPLNVESGVDAFPSVAPATDVTNGLYIGREQAGNYSAVRVYSMLVWNRWVSDLEADFFRQTYNPLTGSGQSANARALVELISWNDITGDILVNQQQRVNPTRGIPQKFHLVTGLNERVQFACETDGVPLRDNELGGDLFTVSFIETANSSTPTVIQEANWSSIFDITFPQPGHYTMLFERPNNGGKFVHIDVQEGP